MHSRQLRAQLSGSMNQMSKEDEEMSRMALSVFRAKEEETEKNKMEIKERVQVQLDLLIQIFSESIYPVGAQDDWIVPEDVAAAVCLPPSTRVPSGRRKKKRILSAWEFGSRKRVYKCRRCGGMGHNKGACSTAI